MSLSTIFETCASPNMNNTERDQHQVVTALLQ